MAKKKPPEYLIVGNDELHVYCGGTNEKNCRRCIEDEAWKRVSVYKLVPIKPPSQRSAKANGKGSK